MSASFPKAQIVVLSSVEWDATWQRHQIFASQWAAHGHDVFFVENTGFRNPTAADLPRVWRRLVRARRPPFHHTAPPPGLTVVSPFVAPPRGAAFRTINDLIFLPRLVENLKNLGLREHPIVVAYLPTSTVVDLIDMLDPALTVYDCVDNFYGLPTAPPDLAKTERALLDRAGLVLTTSSTLFDEKSKQHPRVVELHHGASPAFFLDPAPRDGYRRFCYFGTLWSAVDYAPVAALAQAGFQVDLIGPQKETPPPLPPGVRLLPPIPYRELPAALARYDALLLPYADTVYNRGVIPAKIYECLATGRPVLASPLAALEGLKDSLYVARAPEDWVSAAQQLAVLETPGRIAARVDLAREHTHAKVFSRLRQEVVSAYSARAARALAPAPNGWGRHARAFFRGFTLIGLLYGLAKASTLFTQVFAGRWLGPYEYGRANLVIALAAYLQILPTLGFPTALSKFLATERGVESRRRIVSTTLTVFFLWSALWLALLLAGGHAIAARFGVPEPLYALGLLFSFCTAFYVVVSSPLLGIHRFDHRGVAEALYGLSAPLILLAFIKTGPATHRAMIDTLCLSLLLGSVYSLWSLRHFLRPRFDKALLAPVSRYALVASLNLLAVACVQAPARLILHHYSDPHAVGVFSAYFTATAQIALAFIYMLSSVIVPVTSSPEGQAETWRVFNRLALPVWIGSWALFFASAAAGLALFGRQYPLRWEWAALFSLSAALMLLHGIAAALFAARDLDGLHISAAGSLIAGFGNIALGLLLIPPFGIAGAAFALIGAHLAGILFYGVNAPRALSA